MGDDSFALHSEPEGLSAKALGRALGLSDQTINNYREQGMPVLAETEKGRRYDPAACEAWVVANKPGWKAPGIGKGGAREGAGRKPSSTGDRGGGGGGGVAEDEDGGLTDEDVDLLSDVRHQNEIMKRISNGENLFTVIQQYNISPRLSRVISEMVTAAIKTVELGKAMGKLLEAEDVELAWGGVLGEVDGVLIGLPMLASRELAAEFNLSGDQQAKARTKLAAIVERARSMLRRRDKRGMRIEEPAGSQDAAGGAGGAGGVGAVG